MINLDQIEEWIHEVEERPTSAVNIIRYISGRLRDLSARNEELLAENIQLRTGRKVEEYESRIAQLEYQLDMIKRQLGGEAANGFQSAAVNTLSILIYNIKGQVLRVEQPIDQFSSGVKLAAFDSPPDQSGPVRLAITRATEELLFVFDSGRTETRPVTDIPAAASANLAWQQAFLVEPRGAEELTAVLPIATMSLADYCVQVSRRGCVKKMMKTSFESAVTKSFVGAGIKTRPDKTCCLVLCGKEDVLVLASREGFLVNLDVSQLPYTIEEVLRLSATDYLASAFMLGSKPTILIVAENGKAINREAGWLEKAASFKSKGQPAFSQARRDAGVRVIGAAAVDSSDWAISLNNRGELTAHTVAAVIETGALDQDPSPAGSPPPPPPLLLDFLAFSAPSVKTA